MSISEKSSASSDVHPAVFEAERVMWGPTAEAQALLELYRTASCDASVSTLAVGILERYVEAWQALSSLLHAHGHPALRVSVGVDHDQ